MFFWFVVLGVGILGSFSILIYRTLYPSLETHSEGTRRATQKLHLDVKNSLHRFYDYLSSGFRRLFLVIYSKTDNLLKKNKMSDFVSGRRKIIEKENTSLFLKDIKETRDKVREEFVPEEE